MALTLNESHVRLFALHGSSGDLGLFRKSVAAKVGKLGVDPAASEPFMEEVTDGHEFNLNLRSLLDWIDAIEHPTAGDSKGEAAMKAANIALLGRIAATLAKRYHEPLERQPAAIVQAGPAAVLPAEELPEAIAESAAGETLSTDPPAETTPESIDLPPDHSTGDEFNQ